MPEPRAAEGALRRATIEVTYDPHGASDIDWAYHLRMGDIDCDEALVTSDRALQPFEIEGWKP